MFNWNCDNFIKKTEAFVIFKKVLLVLLLFIMAMIYTGVSQLEFRSNLLKGFTSFSCKVILLLLTSNKVYVV